MIAMLKHLWPRLLPCLFLAISLPIFYKVYETNKLVIDEEFHLRQGKHYCIGNFHVWDSKITTLPGLYLASCILLPFGMCTTFYLRMVSLLASTLNVFLILKIREQSDSRNIFLLSLDTINIAILPPMYFFSHLYYTDILSMTTVLGMYLYWMKGNHYGASAFAVASVLMRQTNIIWAVMMLGISAIDEVLRNHADRMKLKRDQVNLFSLKNISAVLNHYQYFFESIVNILRKFHLYIAVIIAFIVFVVWNGSIVVGDKTNHAAIIHIPQIFYFSIFTLFFGTSLIANNGWQTLKLIKRHWLLYIALVAIAALIVNYNTLAHDYLLADNRHYTFYIWNRFYAKYVWFKFAAIPVYIFALFLITSCLQHKSQSFKLMFWICTFVVLVPQKMLEMRYFLIPFVIIRLNVRKCSFLALIAEFVVYLGINVITFYIFFTKEIYWSNFEEPQRLMW